MDFRQATGLLGNADLYDAPFTLRAPQWPEELFADNLINRIADVLTAIRRNAQPDAISVTPESTARFLIIYRNISESVLHNIVVAFNLPSKMRFVPNTTYFANDTT